MMRISHTYAIVGRFRKKLAFHVFQVFHSSPETSHMFTSGLFSYFSLSVGGTVSDGFLTHISKAIRTLKLVASCAGKSMMQNSHTYAAVRRFREQLAFPVFQVFPLSPETSHMFTSGFSYFSLSVGGTSTHIPEAKLYRPTGRYGCTTFFSDESEGCLPCACGEET